MKRDSYQVPITFSAPVHILCFWRCPVSQGIIPCYGKARLISTRVFQIKLLYFKDSLFQAPPPPHPEKRLFNLIAPTLIYASGTHNSGSATAMLTIFTDEVIFGIILSTFSLEIGITVPGRLADK